MDLSPAKRDILEALLLHDGPVKAAQVAKEAGKEAPATQMHLIGLVKMNLASSPQKGFYLMTESGKKALGLGEVSKESALKILAKVPRDKAFHFYKGIDQPLHLYAHDLLDFCDKVSKVDLDSLVFHLTRGDFEAWFKSLGDEELAMKTALLKIRNLAKENLPGVLQSIVETRCMMLSEKAGA